MEQEMVKRDIIPKKKHRKPRKPLTEDQKNERRERLVKARAKKKPPKYTAIDPSVRDLPDEHPISLKKVREWIKSNKDERDGLKKILRTSNDRDIRNKYNILECYVQDMQAYVRGGIWLSTMYGPRMEHKVKYRCLVMAYHEDGMPKRNVGTWYPDMGCTYTQEMWDEEHPKDAEITRNTPQKRRKKRAK
jgi:hypothetical protein